MMWACQEVPQGGGVPTSAACFNTLEKICHMVIFHAIGLGFLTVRLTHIFVLFPSAQNSS